MTDISSDRSSSSSGGDRALPAAPVAQQVPYQVPSPHGERSDPYYWLRDDTRSKPEVLDYLRAENAYTEAWFATDGGAGAGSGKDLEEQMFAEMRARIQEDDSSVPAFDRGYWYYTRYETGKQHPIYARKPGSLEAPEQLVLDVNQLAAGHSFFLVGGWSISPDGHRVAWGEDTVGRNQFTLRFKDLRTGALLPDTVEHVSANCVWADDETIFYSAKDPVTLRSDRIYRYQLGGERQLVFKEDDGQYFVYAMATKSRRYIKIVLHSTTNSETLLIDAKRPAEPPQVFLPRSADHLYAIDHLDGRFVMRTNDQAKNFRLVEIGEGEPRERGAWRELVAHSPERLISAFALYHDFLSINVRSGGLAKVEILPAGGERFVLDAPDPTYAMSALDLPDPASRVVRTAYDSMTKPSSIYETDVVTRVATLRKQQPVPGYEPSQYASEYLHATASDGTKIPLSIVYKKSTPRDGTAPVLVYGYGSYGSSMDPYFSSSQVSLLDRGWIYAIAHVRGGQELGRAWYEDGKLMKKVNTFTDFIAASEFLVAHKLAARERLFAMGGSAGGLLVGAVMNLRPDLYRGVVALVPFVDVVTTMLDESIPLTTNEYAEWGNPADKAAYDYMLSYSPYDNVRPAAYPALYVRTGLHDSQVQYFEPAKWVARLRATKTDQNPLLFETDLTAGHGGASGRFDKLRQIARALTFCALINARRDPRLPAR